MRTREQNEIIAKAILATQIDPDGLSADDLLSDDQSELLYVAILDALDRSAGIIEKPDPCLHMTQDRIERAAENYAWTGDPENDG